MNLAECIVDYLGKASKEQLVKSFSHFPRGKMEIPEIVRFYGWSRDSVGGKGSFINKFQKICPDLKIEQIFWKDLNYSYNASDLLHKNQTNPTPSYQSRYHDAGWNYWIIYYKERPSQEWIDARFRKGFSGNKMKDDTSLKLESL